MRTEKLSLERGNGGENRTLPRINARFYVLFTSLGVKGNELHVTDQKICTRAVACLRGSRDYRLHRSLLYIISGKI